MSVLYRLRFQQVGPKSKQEGLTPPPEPPLTLTTAVAAYRDVVDNPLGCGLEKLRISVANEQKNYLIVTQLSSHNRVLIETEVSHAVINGVRS